MNTRQKLETILNVDRTGVKPVRCYPGEKACYSISSLAEKAGIPLTDDVLAAGVADFDYVEGSDAPGIWFELE